MVPVLETMRLRLRPLTSGDLDACASMLGDPAVMSFVGGRPLGREDSWRKMLTSAGLWTMLGYGYWAVERKSDGVFLGKAGFADFKRDISPSLEGLPEMGWMFASHSHGHGYASEAVQAGLEWADSALAGQEVVAIIDPGNIASIRVAEKAGFTRAQETDYCEKPILIFRRAARA